MVTITITSGGTFEPPSFELPLGDFVVFVNRDPDAEHQPAPVDKPADHWMDDPLPRYAGDDQPAATSPALTFDGFQDQPPLVYADGLNGAPDRPQGQITFPTS